MKRNLYLKTTPTAESVKRYMQALYEAGSLTPKTERVNVYDSLGRVTASPVFAKCCSPLFNAAAMDGIAVIAAQTANASERNSLQLRRDVDYRLVDTGDPIKAPYDAVIMAEDLIEIDEETVEITASAPGWQHVRPLGEDIVVGEMLLPTNHTIRPVDIGVLLAGGILEAEVFARPKIGIIPTGSEIISPHATPREGEIIDSNTGMFSAMVTEEGGLPTRQAIVEDDYDRIKNAIRSALQDQDMVIVNAGSSAGTEDYTVHVLREIGEVVIHGVSMKPGKPVILAIVDGKSVIGLPGYPVSAYLAFQKFVSPVIAALSGRKQKESGGTIKAVLSKRLVSSLKYEEYVRVRVGKVGGRFVCAPLARGAGAAMSLVRADGFCVIPQNREGYEAGEIVNVELYKDPETLANTLVSVGSHDLIIDLIGDRMAACYPGMGLSGTHVGSLGGLMALKRGETTLAPTHLLDEETGEYNVAYLKKLFAGEEVSLIKGVQRIQGIMIKKGNPLGVTGIEDLPRLRYINRQRGAGTRVLLDYKLKQIGISPQTIHGYEKEAATHMAVAALVASEEADAGMGIRAAAEALNLDFIEIGVEDYDFAIRTQDLKLPQVKAFLQILRSSEFHEKLKEIGGYAAPHAGEIKHLFPDSNEALF